MFDCWFAGFFLGDGNIEKKTLKGSLRLSLKDQHLLYAIVNRFKWHQTRVKIKKNYCRLNFSKSFMLELIDVFKISPLKSYGTVIFPDFLTTTQLKCFILGVYFADGNAKIIEEKNQYRIQFLQSYDFCIKLLEWVKIYNKQFSHYNENNVFRVYTKNSYYDLASLSFSGMGALKLVHWLIKEESIINEIPYLTRKVEKVLNIKLKNLKFYKKIPINKKFVCQKSKNKWTDEEINKLKNFILIYPNYTDEMLSNLLNRSILSIRHKRHELNLKTNNNNKIKTKSRVYISDEIEYIKTFLEQHSNWNLLILKTLLQKINDLPCNTKKLPRTLKALQSFILKNF